MFNNYFAPRVWIWFRAVASKSGPVFRESWSPVRTTGRFLLSSSALYLLLAVMAGYAALDARAPVTMIEPFQLSKSDKMPFTSEIVADSVQDGLKTILNEIEEDKKDSGLRSSDTGLPDLRNILIPKFWRVQTPPRFTVEVKGISYERILSVLRAVMGTETVVSGDVIVDGDQFKLVARAAEAGPWESDPQDLTPDGLKNASKDLARKIVAAEDPTLAGVVLLKAGQTDQGIAALDQAQTLHPSDSRLKLNLCMAFGASRKYDEAIGCYHDVLKMKPSSAQEVSDRLAQIYFLKGERQQAIDSYKTLHKQGYQQALLGLGEALDEEGRREDAIDAYNEFLTTQPSNRDCAIAHLRKSTALSHLGKHKEALEEYQHALKYAPRDLLILVREGVELGEAGDVDSGVAELQAAVDENQNSESLPFALLQLGLLLEKKGDWQGAIIQFQDALNLRPNYPEAHLQLAKALAHQGNIPDSRYQFGQYAKLSPIDQERGNFQMLAHHWLGNELHSLGKDSDAESEYFAATQMRHNDSAGHCQLARMFAKQRRYQQAFKEYKAALVPATLEELNDDNCLADAQKEVFPDSKRGQAVARAESHKGINAQASATHGQPGPSPEQPAPIEQAVLRSGS